MNNMHEANHVSTKNIRAMSETKKSPALTTHTINIKLYKTTKTVVLRLKCQMILKKISG